VTITLPDVDLKEKDCLCSDTVVVFSERIKLAQKTTQSYSHSSKLQYGVIIASQFIWLFGGMIQIGDIEDSQIQILF
jgi:hypothetical protein